MRGVCRGLLLIASVAILVGAFVTLTGFAFEPPVTAMSRSFDDGVGYCQPGNGTCSMKPL